MEYKDFIIKVEKLYEGYYMYAYRISDNWVLVDEWNRCIQTKRKAINECIITIEDCYKNPKNYED